MYIQSNARYLQLIHRALEAVNVARLEPQDRALIAMVKGGVRELYKREGTSLEFLPALATDGKDIVSRMETLLATGANRTADSVETAGNVDLKPLTSLTVPTFQDLRHLNNRINKSMTGLSMALAALVKNNMSPAVDQKIAELMKEAADWDHRYMVLQRRTIDFPAIETAAKVRGGEDLNHDNLERFMQSHHPLKDRLRLGELLKMPGGMGKDTYLIEVRSDDGFFEELVVRKDPPDPVIKFGAFIVSHEYELLKAVAEAGYNAPLPIMLAHDEPQFDTDFFIMKRLPGSVLGTFFGPIGKLSEQTLLGIAENMARLHELKIELFANYINRYLSPSLLTGDVQSACRRQILSWQRYVEEEQLTPSPAAIYFLKWLLDNVPRNSGRPVLVHGDFNIQNILGQDGKVTGVIDWESAGFGDPAQDLAYIKPNIQMYIDWPKFLDHYYACGGRRLDESTFGYYTALANFRNYIGVLKWLDRFDRGATQDARAMYLENEFLPQFVQNIFDNMQQT